MYIETTRIDMYNFVFNEEGKTFLFKIKKKNNKKKI